jgi:creatinine amidohydrolase
MASKKTSLRWAEDKAPALGRNARRLLVIWPLASTEQHGPHLPTGTDAMINNAIQEGLIARPVPGVVQRILPTLTIGASEHHIPFGGTLSLPPVQYSQLLTQGLRCLLRQGHRRILLLNSHGGNQAPMQTALAEVALDASAVGARVGGFSYWQVCQSEWQKLKPPGRLSRIGHACGIETSIILHLRPELVDRRLAKDDPLHPILDQPICSALSFDLITRNGLIGYPSAATAKWGRILLDGAVNGVREAIQTWLRAIPK